MPLDRFQKSTNRLVKRYGSVRKYIQQEVGEYNVDTQTVDVVERTYNVLSHKSNPNYVEKNSPNLINKQSMVIVIPFSELPIVPKVGDKIEETILTETYTMYVLDVSYRALNGGVVLWRLLCSSEKS